jgi:hypothetical protein
VIFRPGLAEVQNPEVSFFLSTAELLLVRRGFVGLEFWAYDSKLADSQTCVCGMVHDNNMVEYKLPIKTLKKINPAKTK